MVSAELMNKLDLVLRMLRHILKQPNAFSGGVGVIVCSNYAQLPPLPLGSDIHSGVFTPDQASTCQTNKATFCTTNAFKVKVLADGNLCLLQAH